MVKRFKIIALIGKSASGKDTLLNKLASKLPEKLHKKISTTTRPARDYEKDGVDYFFTTPTEFAEKVMDGSMLEASSFNDWFFGTEIKGLSEDKINIGVFNPDGVMALLEDPSVELDVVFVLSSDKTRLIRSLQRESNPDIDEIFRRFKADREDFFTLDFNYCPILNEEGTSMDELADIVIKIFELDK